MGLSLVRLVKPIRIDFVHGQGWRTVWVCAAVVCVALVAATAWKWQKLDRATRETRDQIAAIEQELQRARTPVLTKVDPRQTSIDQAVKLLSQDLNKAFATVEGLQEPGVRLRTLTLDATSNTLRLEYDLDSVVKASSVTAALNGGYDNAPWKLESVSGSATSPTGGVALPTRVFRGVWSVQMENL